VAAIILDLFSSKPTKRKKLFSNASLPTFSPNMPPKRHKSSATATRTSFRETTATNKVLENRVMAASKDKFNKLVETALVAISSASELDEAIVSTTPKQCCARKPLTPPSPVHQLMIFFIIAKVFVSSQCVY
jgi:hypothetical protein